VVESFDQAKEATGSRRAIVDGALLGTCFLFINSMLSLQQPDSVLSIALKAFVIAIPFLIWGFIWATYQFASARVVVGVSALVRAMGVAVAIHEIPGQLAVFVGVCAVVWHLDRSAALTLLISSAAVMVVGFITGGVVLVLYALGLYKRGSLPATATQKPHPQMRRTSQ
jgi:hypothetical protein